VAITMPAPHAHHRHHRLPIAIVFVLAAAFSFELIGASATGNAAHGLQAAFHPALSIKPNHHGFAEISIAKDPAAEVPRDANGKPIDPTIPSAEALGVTQTFNEASPLSGVSNLGDRILLNIALDQALADNGQHIKKKATSSASLAPDR
jgi:hypothetical protein